MEQPPTLLPASCTVVPKFRGKWKPRSGLMDTADQFGEYRFCVITALPGSGKSRFMARIHAELQIFMHICCWLRMAPQMQAPGMVARSIAMTFARSVLGDKSATQALLMGNGVPPSTILMVALNEIAAFDGSVVLFVDDVHMVDDDASLADLQTMIDNAPENLRIVLSSRKATRLKLARLRNDGQLLELQNADFAMSFKQLPEIVTDAGLPRPSLAELRELWSRTGGWLAGIRLLARGSLRPKGEARQNQGFAVSKDLIDYFEEEILSGLSDEARGALDAMLTPRRLVHDLMIDLIGEPDAARYIAELESRCLLTRSTEGNALAYKAAPLLVHATRAKSLLSADEVRALHRRCTDWFTEAGHLTTAAAHAVDSGDFERAIALIESCGIDMISHGDVVELQAWLPLLPVEKLRERPVALLAVAWALSLLYRLDEAAALLAQFDIGLVDDPGLRDHLDRNVSALRVMQMSMRDDFAGTNAQGIAWRERYPTDDGWFGNVVDNSISFSLALAGDPDRGKLVLEHAYLPDYYANNPYAAIYSRCILGLIDLRAGEVRRAEANFAWAVKKAETDMNPGSTGAVMAAGLLAGACYERGDVTRMTELMGGYAWSLHAHLFTDARIQAYRAVSRVQSQRGQYRAAISSLERILDAGPAVRLPRVHVDVLAEKIAVALEHQDTRAANAYSRALGDQLAAMQAGDQLRPYVEAALYGSQAHLDIVLGAPESAISMLRKAIRLDLAGGWHLRAFRWAVLAVRAQWRQGKQRQAERLMDRLLSRAVRSGVFRTILDGGRDIEAVLRRLHERQGARSGDARRYALLVRLRETFDPDLVPAPPDEPESAASGQLTEREIELIRFVRAGLTNRQIAERMKVSENTIKWHLKNVFEKASVKRRADLANLVLS